MADEVLAVTDEQKEAWKKVYGDIYGIDVAGETYIYRGLQRTEHRTIREKLQAMTLKNVTGPAMANGQAPPQINEDAPVDEDALDEEVVRTCLLNPKMDTQDKLDQLKSGVVPLLAGEIMRISGYIPDSAPVKL